MEADENTTEGDSAPAPYAPTIEIQDGHGEEVPNDGILTLNDFKNQLYIQNPGVQFISISRGRILEKILGVYKDPELSIFKKPKVEFQGESGKVQRSIALCLNYS